jgi:hypothetical protein
MTFIRKVCNFSVSCGWCWSFVGFGWRERCQRTLTWIEPPAPLWGRPGASILFGFRRFGSGQRQAIGGFVGRHVQSQIGIRPDHPGFPELVAPAKGQYRCPFSLCQTTEAGARKD